MTFPFDNDSHTSFPKRQFSIGYLDLFKVFLSNFLDAPNKELAKLSDKTDQLIKKQSLYNYPAISESKILELWGELKVALGGQDLLSQNNTKAIILPKGSYHLMENLLYSVRDLATGLEELKTFYPLVNPLHHLHYSVSEDNKSVTIHISPWSKDLTRTNKLAMEFEGYWLKTIFSRFHCEGEDIHIKQAWNELTLTISIHCNLSKISSPDYDPQLFESLKKEASQKYKETLGVPIESITGKFGRRVVRIIQSHPLEKAGNLEFVADKLALSSRSLQRRLGDEKLSFTTLLSNIKMEMAKQLLIDTEGTTTYISEILGFSEPSALNRAFKQKFDLNPTEFRAKWKSPHHALVSTNPGSLHNP